MRMSRRNPQRRLIKQKQGEWRLEMSEKQHEIELYEIELEKALLREKDAHLDVKRIQCRLNYMKQSQPDE